MSGTDLEDIATHLAHLTYGLPDGAGFVISTDVPSFGRAFDQLATADNVDEMAERCALLPSSVWVSTTATDADSFDRVQRKGRLARGGETDARYLVALHADIDVAGPGHKSDRPLAPTFDEAHALLEQLPPASLLVNTGGGLQPWWLLEDPLAIEDRSATKAVIRRWVTNVDRLARLRGWEVDQTGELARVLRLAGTVNHKPELTEPLPVRLVGWQPSETDPTLPHRYRLEELVAVMPAEEPTPAKRKPSPSSTTSTTPQRTKQSSGKGLDILNACNAAPWSEVWPAGWEYVRSETLDGATVELWKRPGASSEYSARCWRDGGCQVWSDGVDGLAGGLTDGKHSKADILAWRHRVSLSTLARELTDTAYSNARKGRR